MAGFRNAIFFNKELYVDNQMPLSFSADQMTAVTGFYIVGAVYYFNGTDNPKTQSKLVGKSSKRDAAFTSSPPRDYYVRSFKIIYDRHLTEGTGRLRGRNCSHVIG